VKRLSAIALLAVLSACTPTQSRAAPGQAGPILDAALDRPATWFASDEAAQLADHIVSWQNANGGWWKTYDPNVPRPAMLPEPAHDDGPPGDTQADWRRTSTIDNGATYTELRLLARVISARPTDAHKAAFARGVKFLLDAQYPNGGWPQRFPVEKTYGRRITFNDDAMVNVMRLLRDVAAGKEGFSFVDTATREQCHAAFDRGVECILASQIKHDGKLTGWCQQHDEVTLAPTSARTYELPSISGSESAGIVVLLMELEKPDARTRTAIEGAIAWFESVKITGKKVANVTGSTYENGKDRQLVDDPDAPPIWGRFYDIETNKPFFASRDGIKRENYADISWERRNKYSWFGNSGSKALQAYEKWKTRADVVGS
jgi:PelA/Pel-15E family pectate lyase